MAPADPPSEQGRVAALEAELAAMRQTISWRVTRPLRAVRRRARAQPAPEVPIAAPTNPVLGDPSADEAVRFSRRVAAVASIFEPTSTSPTAVGASMALLVDVLRRADVSDGEGAWLALVAATGIYPAPALLASTRRAVRRDGLAALALLAEGAFRDEVARRGSLPDLEVLVDQVLVDISQTTGQDLHSGIQRVSRECSSRWLRQHDDTVLVHFDEATTRLVRLSAAERARAVAWHDHLHASGSAISRYEPEHATGATVVPWRCVHVIPEFVESRTRVDAYVGLRDAGVTRGLSMVGYDLIPVTASELTYPGITQSFGHYLSLIKRADVISTISRSSGDEFRSFMAGMADQGLRPPRVVARTLPSGGPDPDEADEAAVRSALALGERPLVLAVGSHEPRKNHLTILEAAERAWRAGHSFELLFVGAFSWGAEEFEAEARRLADLGHPVQIRQRVDERSLWALYRVATFTVFISLVEGFGLPIAESLRCGTPVVTSGYGSMAEIAAGGGAVQVDPRDARDVADAMVRLLTDAGELDSLRGAARARVWRTWPEYADDVWTDLVTTLDGGPLSGARLAPPRRS